MIVRLRRPSLTVRAWPLAVLALLGAALAGWTPTALAQGQGPHVEGRWDPPNTFDPPNEERFIRRGVGRGG